MTAVLCKADYEKAIASTRDQRMAWFREARFGMFIHYGVYALYGRHEWVMALEQIPVPEILAALCDALPAPARSGAADFAALI